MSQTINVPAVRIVVFNKAVVTRLFLGKARVSWKNDKAGSIVKRNPDNGRFMSIPFFVAR